MGQHREETTYNFADSEQQGEAIQAAWALGAFVLPTADGKAITVAVHVDQASALRQAMDRIGNPSQPVPVPDETPSMVPDETPPPIL